MASKSSKFISPFSFELAARVPANPFLGVRLSINFLGLEAQELDKIQM
jgi:hypothetical protein